MDVVAGLRILLDGPPPVNGDHFAVRGGECGGQPGDQPGECGVVQVVEHFAEDDESKRCDGQSPAMSPTWTSTCGWRASRRLARSTARGLTSVHTRRPQRAARPSLSTPDRATRLENRPVSGGPRECGEGQRVLAPLIPPRGETPGGRRSTRTCRGSSCRVAGPRPDPLLVGSSGRLMRRRTPDRAAAGPGRVDRARRRPQVHPRAETSG